MKIWLVLPCHAVICSNMWFHPSCHRMCIILVNIALEIVIIDIMGVCSMQPAIFTDVFCLRESFLVVVLVKFFFNFFTFSWRDFMRSNIYNCTLSFAQIVALSTWVNIGVSGGTLYWSLWFEGILSSACDTRCCTFCTSWRTWPAM